MKTIYRYTLNTPGPCSICTYRNCEILDVGIDPRGMLSVWIMVDTKEPMDNQLQLYIAGTGWDFLPDNLHFPVHVGTVRQGEYMWHVFKEDSDFEVETL